MLGRKDILPTLSANMHGATPLALLDRTAQGKQCMERSAAQRSTDFGWNGGIFDLVFRLGRARIVMGTQLVRANKKVNSMHGPSSKRLQLVISKPSTAGPGTAAQRRIAVLALPNTALSDLAGPYEAFLLAGRLGQQRLKLSQASYEVTLLSIAGSSIVTLSGLGITGARPFHTYQGSPDTLVVTGEPDSLDASADHSALFRWLRTVASESRRVCSVCTGVYCLAAAGLLDRRHVTTHWRFAADLARQYPTVHVDPEPLFVRDGKFYTSAGCTAAMDVSLALIEEDLGVEIAAEIAAATLMSMRRPGRQAQISPLLNLQMSDREPLRELQAWMLEHLHLPLTVEDLAAQVHMSPRNFARSFVAAVGTAPARFLETLRVEAARRRLEETARSMDQIASECGFGSAEVMRRSFIRNLGIPPSACRRESGIA
jgi:transcriptional regulator GlxA family with amidase domain